MNREKKIIQTSIIGIIANVFLDGAIETNTGWYCTAESLRLVDQPPEIEPEIEWDMIIK